MVVIVLGVDLCRSVAINLDEERRHIHERNHRCEDSSDDGEAVRPSGETPDGSSWLSSLFDHGDRGNHSRHLCRVASCLVSFAPNSETKIPRTNLGALGVMWVFANGRGLPKQFWLEMDRKTRTQKHERHAKPRNDDNDDDDRPSWSQCIHPILPL